MREKPRSFCILEKIGILMVRIVNIISRTVASFPQNKRAVYICWLKKMVARSYLFGKHR